MIKKSTNLKMTTTRTITTTTTTTTPTKGRRTTKAKRTMTTTKRTTPTPTSSAPSTNPSSTASEMETAIAVTLGEDTLSNRAAKTEEDDLHPRIPIDDVKDNSLENINNKPQGLGWIDFDYNSSNNPDEVERIDFGLTFGGNFYAYDYDHVIFPRSPKAIVAVP